MRFGLIGYGLWGKFHAEAIRKAPGAELTAIACASEPSAAAAREAYPDLPVHLGWRALLADTSIEAVDIVVPNHLHAEIAIAALEAGKDVLLEKPMAGTIADDRVQPRPLGRVEDDADSLSHGPDSHASQPA